MLRSLKPLIDVAKSLAPIAITGDGDGAAVDLKGYDSCLLLAVVGAIASSGLVLPVAYESDASSGSWTAVAAADLDGAFVNCVAGTAQVVGYKGTKRYVMVASDYVSGTSVVIGYYAIRGNPATGPLN